MEMKPMPAGMFPEIRLNLPPYQEFVLPSRGLFYGDTLPGGVIHIRPMTIREEKILATDRLSRTGEAMNLVFENCIQEKFPVRDLLSADKAAIFLWLRAASYGPEYNIEVACPECRTKIAHQVNLETDLNVTYAPPDLVEPMVVNLPRCKKKVEFVLPRSRHEEAIMRMKQQTDALNAKTKNKNAIDHSITDRLKILISNVEGVDKQLIGEWLETLIAYDASKLREAVSKDYFGVDTKLGFACKNVECQAEFTVDLPITKDFFRPND